MCLLKTNTIYTAQVLTAIGCGKWNFRPCGGRALSEIFGEGALNYDRMERRRGMGYGADQRWLYGKARQVLAFVQDYVDGVNAYINQLHPKDYPGVQAFRLRARGMDNEENSFTLDVRTKMLAGEMTISSTKCASPCWGGKFQLAFPDF